MFILFGESLRTSHDQAGTRRCDRCDAEEEFFHITEVNYFSLFAIPIFPVSKVADYFICGNTYGKVRAMIDHNGKLIEKTYPSSPVEILGLNEKVQSGDELIVVESENEAKNISEFKKTGSKEKENQSETLKICRKIIGNP